MQAHEGAYPCYEGQGSMRQLGAGQRSTLTQHFDSKHGEFVTLQTEHEAVDNLGADITRLLSTTEIESGSYRNRFVIVPAEASITPPYRRRPTAPEGQAAVVTADDGAPLIIDRNHRVRVRPPWLHAPEANAFSNPSNSDRSQITTWVHAAGVSADPSWSDNHLPRAGTQALPTFIDGDIDHSAIAMQLHNTQDALSWAPADAPFG